MELRRLSLNQMTIPSWDVSQAVLACSQQQVPWIGLWRHKLHDHGVNASRKILAGTTVKISSLCRGGMFPAGTIDARARKIDDNRRAIDEAAELGTSVLILVAGPAQDCSLDDARVMVEDGIHAMVDYAQERAIKLALEPLHPVFAADRSVIVSLAQANDLVERIASPYVGVAIDVYHVWWDPHLYEEIARARGHIFGFHVSDWMAPVHNALMSRGMMGDGCIEIRRIRQAVESAEYQGPVEVEIFNQAIWDMPGHEVLSRVKERFVAVV